MKGEKGKNVENIYNREILMVGCEDIYNRVIIIVDQRI